MQVAAEKREIMHQIKRLIAILTLVPSIAFGSLIDLTPGGFNVNDPFPEAFTKFIVTVNAGPRTIMFFDSFYTSPTNGFPTGWVSQYGALHGGDFIHIDLTGPVPVTTFAWDFGDSGFYLTNVLTEGDAWAHLYGIGAGTRFTGEGTITLNGIIDINSIAFYGKNINQGVPDTGTTLGLFVIGLLGLFTYRKK
jgi:hypothetical protein